jgi:hypothetical protein
VYGETTENSPVFGDIPDTKTGYPVRLLATEFLTTKLNAAGSRSHHTHNTFQGSRFADSISAKKANQFPLFEFERNAMQDMALTIIAVNSLDF